MNVFFLSSRRRHTRYWRDWSSDVCSSDLRRGGGGPCPCRRRGGGAERDAGRRGDRRQRGAAGARCHLRPAGPEIGRASCRDRVSISAVAASFKNNTPPTPPPPAASSPSTT